jgi:hypothetical protein
MKYIRSYQLFLESNKEDELIDLLSNIEQIAKSQGLDIKADEEQIAKELLNKIEQTPEVNKDIEMTKSSIQSSLNESAGALGFQSILHTIEANFETGEHIETVGHDIVPHDTHREVFSKIKKIWHIVVKVIKWVTKPVGYIFDLFEKAIFWIARKVFGASFETSYKAGKFTFAVISIVLIIAAIVAIKELVAVSSGLGFISSLFLCMKKGVIFAKLKSVAQSVWSCVKKINQARSNENRLMDPVEFFDFINKISKDKKIQSTFDVHTLQDYFQSQDYKTKKIISQNLSSIANAFVREVDGVEKIKRPNIPLQQPLPFSHKGIKRLNFDKIIKIPYLRKLLLPVIPIEKLGELADEKIELIKYSWEKETIDDFKKYISGQWIDSYNKYVDVADDDISKRFGHSLENLKDFGKENAEILFKAMDGPGTDEESIYSVFDKIKSEDYFWSVYLEFGLRQDNDLIEWLFGDLNENDLYELSFKLKKIGWKKGWNVSEILKDSLEEYHKNNPEWSLSISGWK